MLKPLPDSLLGKTVVDCEAGMALKANICNAIVPADDRQSSIGIFIRSTVPRQGLRMSVARMPVMEGTCVSSKR